MPDGWGHRPFSLVCRCWGAALQDAPRRTLAHQDLKRQDTDFQLTPLRDENLGELLERVSLAMEEQKQLVARGQTVVISNMPTSSLTLLLLKGKD